MTNETIKENLKKLYDCKNDFTVTQTDKKSPKVNGLYKPVTKEIFIHNRNFSSDNELIFTAIHEFTHHILTTEKNMKSAKSHTCLFWATFYNLIDKAESIGIYSRKRSEATEKLINEVSDIQKELIETQKKLGKVITKLYKSCIEKGERIEDVIEHDCQITRKKAKELMQMATKEAETSDEMTKAIDSAKDEKQRKAAIQAVADGKTLNQVKTIARSTISDDGLDTPSQLIKEKNRLEKTIEKLNDRLIQVEETLRSMES